MGVAHEDHVTEVIGRGDEVAEAMQLLQGALRGSKEEREEERWSLLLHKSVADTEELY